MKKRFSDEQIISILREAEAGVWGVTGTENVTPSAAAASTASLSQVRTVRSVISQIRAFSILPVRLFRLSSGIFRVATIICSWLT